MRRSKVMGAGLIAALVGCGPEDVPSDPCAGQAPGTACTWLGTKGSEGFNGDGLPRFETQVNQVQDLVFLPDGTAWLTDFNNHLVRRVRPDGTVETVVGWTDPIFPGDGPLGGIPAGGASGKEWQLFHPTGLVRDGDGLVAVAWHDHKLLHVDPSGWVTVACGGGPSGSGSGFGGDGGPALEALFDQPSAASADDEGNLYIVDQRNLRIRILRRDGTVDTFAGTGEYGTSGDGGPASEATFSWAGGSNPNPGGGILHHAGKLYVADTEAHRIRVIDLASGIIEPFAGDGTAGYGGDGGPALEASFRGPRDMAIGPDESLYVADTDNGAVRAISLDGATVRTVVGTGALSLDEGEQLPATGFALRRPFGVAFDPDGNLYVADSLNHRIVKIAR